MWKIILIVSACLTLVSSPCDGTQTPEPAETTVTEALASTTGEVHVFPRRIDDTITYNVGDSSYVKLWDKILYPLNNGESTEEQQGYTYNTYNYNVPSTLNFHDIYSNSLALLAEDLMMTTAKNDDPLKDDPAFHLNNINTRLVEFHPKTHMIPPNTNTTSMYASNSSYVTKFDNTTSANSSTTTEEPDEVSVEVLPIKKEAYERGLLDLLFPAPRVRTFKSVFDTFRRLMSHTFR